MRLLRWLRRSDVGRVLLDPASLCGRWGYFAGGGAVGGPPPRSPITWPSGSVTETNRPPGSPFLNGLSVTLTLSPFFNVVDFQPARTRNVGDVISSDHVTVPPLSFGTSTSIHECGFPHRNSLTTPLTVTDFVRSMPADE